MITPYFDPLICIFFHLLCSCLTQKVLVSLVQHAVSLLILLRLFLLFPFFGTILPKSPPFPAFPWKLVSHSTKSIHNPSSVHLLAPSPSFYPVFFYIAPPCLFKHPSVPPFLHTPVRLYHPLHVTCSVLGHYPPLLWKVITQYYWESHIVLVLVNHFSMSLNMKNMHQNLLLKVFGVLMIPTLKSPMRYCIVLQYYLHFIIYKKITHEKSISYKNNHDG